MKKWLVAGAVVLMAVLSIAALFRGGDRTASKPASDSAAELPDQTSTEASSASGAHSIDVDYLSQVERFPCGCESVSAVMALRHAGYDYDAESFIDRFLPTGDDPYFDDDGMLRADSPYEVFIGSPYSESSYGCYAPVIRRAMESAIDAAGAQPDGSPSGASPAYRVADLTGTTLEELCRAYIDRDIPVIVWGTIGMRPIQALTEWITPDGEEFTWKSQEHCLLLVGYDENSYYFNDPIEGKNTAYAKADAENAYRELYSQALALVKNGR